MRYEHRIMKTNPTSGLVTFEQVNDNTGIEDIRTRVARLREQGFSPILQRREVGPWEDVVTT
jgi:hypothetical protein